MAVATTIKKEAFKEKLNDLKENGFFIEYKENKEHWKKRLEGLTIPNEIVFLVGSKPYKFRITKITKTTINKIPKKYESFLESESNSYFFAIKCEN